MTPKLKLLRRALYRRRVDAAHDWRDAERAQVAEYNAAVRRILDQHAARTTDSAGRPA